MNEPPQMLSSWIQVDIPPNSEKRKEEGLLKQFFLVTCAPVLQFSCEVAPGVRGPTAVGVRGVEAEADGRDRGMGQPQGQQVSQLDLSDGDDVLLLSPTLYPSSASWRRSWQPARP